MAPGPPWDGLVKDLVALATSRFIDPDTGIVREFFDEAWAPTSDIILPGHQFEWAWLMARTGEASLIPLAERLYTAGDAGVGFASSSMGASPAPASRKALEV